MPTNSAVMEIAPYQNDARCLLGGGPFSRASVLLGHDYAMHHPVMDEYVWKHRAAEFNITRFSQHLKSFLKNIGKF